MDELKEVNSASNIKFTVNDSKLSGVNISKSELSFREYLEDNKEIKDDNELTLFQKLCFAVAGLPYQVYFCVIGVFSTVYLLEYARLPPSKIT